MVSSWATAAALEEAEEAEAEAEESWWRRAEASARPAWRADSKRAVRART